MWQNITNCKIKGVSVDRNTYDAHFSGFIYSLFTTSQWIDSMASDGQAIYINFVKDDQVVGKIAGLVLHGGFFSGKCLYFYAGPALRENDQSLYYDCMLALKRLAVSKRFSRIEFSYHDQQYPWMINADGFFKEGWHDYILFFNNRNEEPVFDKSVLGKVKKAIRAGVSFHSETSERVLNRLFELLEETQRIRFGVYGDDYMPFPYFQMNKQTLRKLFDTGILKLYHASVGDTIHCVRCSMCQDNKMVGLMIASDEFTYKNGVQQFVQVNVIRELHRQGYHYFNIGSAAPGEKGKGLSKYKESLGFDRVSLYGAYTHFLIFPQNIINPVMRFGRKMSKYEQFGKIANTVSKILVKARPF